MRGAKHTSHASYSTLAQVVVRRLAGVGIHAKRKERGKTMPNLIDAFDKARRGLYIRKREVR